MVFSKMHGLGNDFIVVDASTQPFDESTLGDLSIRICDRHFGVGADGLLLIMPSEIADLRMRIFNSDGSEPEMCGNGIRCAAKFAYERGISEANPVRVESLAGIMVVDLTIKDGSVTAARVDMGKPHLVRSRIPMLGEGDGPVIGEPLLVDGREYAITCVSMGNPHCIAFVDDASSFPVEQIGRSVERHPSFPKRTNAEFVQVLNRKEIRMKVWERGAGRTLACGTGACASAVASVLNNFTDRRITVRLDGGDLQIEWQDGGSVFMTGPAVEVFTGEITTEMLSAWSK